MEVFFSKYDINGTINSTAIINEHNLSKQLIQVIDIFGRESKGLKNQPLFYIYDDGTVEKKYFKINLFIKINFFLLNINFYI